MAECVFCKGTATELRYEPLIEAHLCESADLCRLAQVFEYMLRGVKSA